MYIFAPSPPHWKVRTIHLCTFIPLDRALCTYGHVSFAFLPESVQLLALAEDF